MWSFIRLGVVVAASLLAVVPNLFFCQEVSEGTPFSVTEDSTSNTVQFKCDIGRKFDFPNWTLDGDEVIKLNLTDAVVTNFDGDGITQFNISRSVVEGRTVGVEIDGELCSILYCSNSTNSTCEPQGNTSQPTNFNCSMGATVCVVECTWEVPAGGSRPVNFTLRLPDGSEDSIPGNETSYSVVLICDGGGPQEVAITSDGNTDHVIYSIPTAACQSSCSTSGFFGQPLVAPLIVCVLIGLITIVVLSILIHALRPRHLTVTNLKGRLEQSTSKYRQLLPPDPECIDSDIELNLDGTVRYQVSWSVLLKRARQRLMVYRYEGPELPEKKVIDVLVSRKHHCDINCRPGSEYRAVVKSVLVCCSLPFCRPAIAFLTEVTFTQYPNDAVEIERDHSSPEHAGDVTVTYVCGQYQPVREVLYNMSQKDKVMCNTCTSTTDVERSVTIPTTSLRNGEYNYNFIVETLPSRGKTKVLRRASNSITLSVNVRVLPRKPTHVVATNLNWNTVELIWEQEYQNEDEKPTEYFVKVEDRPDLSGRITPTVRKVSPTKCKCEHTLERLEPGTAYKVVITAKNEDGAQYSDEASFKTERPVEGSHSDDELSLTLATDNIAILGDDMQYASPTRRERRTTLTRTDEMSIEQSSLDEEHREPTSTEPAVFMIGSGPRGDAAYNTDNEIADENEFAAAAPMGCQTTEGDKHTGACVATLAGINEVKLLAKVASASNMKFKSDESHSQNQ